MSGFTAAIIRFPDRQGTAGFTTIDLVGLYRWSAGDKRLEISRFVEGLGQFAQIFKPGESWASWTLGREDGQIRLWDSLTQADIGRFATVQDALSALSGEEPVAPIPHRPTAEVVFFRQRA